MPLSEYEQCQILTKMLEASWLNFDRRRSYEWKLNLGIWTATAAFIALSLGQDVSATRLSTVSSGFTCSLAILILVIQGFFLFRVKLANACDQARALHYELLLNRFVGVDFGVRPVNDDRVRQRITQATGWHRMGGWWSTVVQMTITAILLCIAAIVLFSGPSSDALLPASQPISDNAVLAGRGGVWAFVFDGLIAGGTMLLVIVVVFQERIHVRLSRPEIAIRENPGGSYVVAPLRGTTSGEIPAYWFGLLVANERPIRPARNCRVLLDGLWRWDATLSRWDDNPPPIAYPFTWAPGHLRRESVTVYSVNTFDFARMIGGDRSEGMFEPELLYRANTYDATLNPGQAGCYLLRIEAEGLDPQPRQAWLVGWDEGWESTSKNFAEFISLREVDVEEGLKNIRDGRPLEEW